MGGETETPKERKKKAVTSHRTPKGDTVCRAKRNGTLPPARSNRRYVLATPPRTSQRWPGLGSIFRKLKDNGVHPVGQKQPNPFGLFDTLGNVWEVCADQQLQQAFLAAICHRMSRGHSGGGQWAASCTPELRLSMTSRAFGFRIVREIAPSSNHDRGAPVGPVRGRQRGR